MNHFLGAALACSLALGAPAAAAAQTSASQGPEDARFTVGPLGLSPRLALTNAGVDTNVFNEADSPTRDVTATFVPSLESTMRIGPTLLTSRSGAEFVYFGKARGQRSSGFSQEGRIDVLLARLTPFVAAGRLTTYQRPSVEIDARVRQVTTFAMAGVQLRTGSRVTIDIEGGQRQTRFADVASGGFNVADALDRRGDLARVSLGIAVTPLTTVRLNAESLQERFAASSFRDTNSLAATAGFAFKPFALISGSALVGARHVTSKSGELPEFTGVVSSIDVVYVWREMTRIAVGVSRNLESSLESDQPYYVLTGGSLSLTQAIARRWDVVLRGSRQTLDYRRRLTRDPSIAGRRDRSDMVGLGVGFRAAEELRIGFDATRMRRRSAADGRSYEGFRFGGSVTYGTN